jgi:hypothetical protein
MLNKHESNFPRWYDFALAYVVLFVAITILVDWVR